MDNLMFCHGAASPIMHKMNRGYIRIKCPVCHRSVYGAGEDQTVKKWNDLIIDVSLNNLGIRR